MKPIQTLPELRSKDGRDPDDRRRAILSAILAGNPNLDLEEVLKWLETTDQEPGEAIVLDEINDCRRLV